MDRMHVLHIGKTGGSALASALGPYCAEADINLHGHDVTLRDVPVGERVAFLVRDPVARFISGFNSRLRKGAPRNFNEWTPGERRAFERFATPDALAEGLAAERPDVRAAAHAAMADIYHPARHLKFWLHSLDYLVERRADIAFVGCTETLDADVEALIKVLNIRDAIALPKDLVGRHATPPGYTTVLSSDHAAIIRDWYREDYPVYEQCLQIRRACRNAGIR